MLGTLLANVDVEKKQKKMREVRRTDGDDDNEEKGIDDGIETHSSFTGKNMTMLMSCTHTIRILSRNLGV